MNFIVNWIVSMEEATLQEVSLAGRACFIYVRSLVVVALTKRIPLAFDNVVVTTAHIGHMAFSSEKVNAWRSHDEEEYKLN